MAEGHAGLDMDLLKLIMSFKPEYKFFVWLYLPMSIIDIDEVIEIRKTISLPDYVFLRKLIVYCKYQSMDLYETIDFLFEKGLIKNEVEDMMIIEEAFEAPIRFNELNEDVVSKIIDCAKKFYSLYDSKKSVKHDRYPIVDEQKGRPMLGWLKCYHHDCNFKGRNADELRVHLEKCDAYTAYFHKSHENMVDKLELTPDKVKADGLTKCPSAICNKVNAIKTPDDLIYHFKRLGIPPFWKVGDVIDYGAEIDGALDIINAKPIYVSDDCVVCLEKHSTILFLDCNHHAVCMDCYVGMKECPMCKKGVTMPICY